MSRKRKTTSLQGGRSERAASGRHGRGPVWESVGLGETRDTDSTQCRSKWPVLRFVGLFAFFMSLAYACEITPSIRKHVFPAYLRHNAWVSGVILRGLGEDASVHRQSISSPRYALEVQHGCNALLPTALFVSAALASPVSFALKIPGIVLGTLALMLMNLVRIVSMFYLGVYMPKFFDSVHAHVWPGIFICLSLFLWITWAVWARERGGGFASDTG